MVDRYLCGFTLVKSKNNWYRSKSKCKKLEKNGFKIYIGNQSDKKFWDNIFKKKEGNILY